MDEECGLYRSTCTLYQKKLQIHKKLLSGNETGYDFRGKNIIYIN